MVDERTERLINQYMMWTNKKVLTPEEFLMFRKQALEEECNGIKMCKTERNEPQDPTPVRQTQSPSCVSHRSSTDCAERCYSAEQPTHKETELGVSVKENKYGLSDGEFLSLMQSVEG